MSTYKVTVQIIFGIYDPKDDNGGDLMVISLLERMQRIMIQSGTAGQSWTLARYNDDILFGEVWSRNDKLSLHDRSLVTISALVGAGVIDSSLKYHITTAKKNGVTKDEMIEMITQLGFYAGWPKAWAAFRMAKEVYADGAK